LQFTEFFADLTSAMLLWGVGLGAAFWALAKILEVWLRIKQLEYWESRLEPLDPPKREVPT